MYVNQPNEGDLITIRIDTDYPSSHGLKFHIYGPGGDFRPFFRPRDRDHG